MANTIVVALDISRRDKEKLTSFMTDSFEVQLSKIERKIRDICSILTTKNAEQWMIAWREYGLTDGLHNRYLTIEQKSQLKSTLARITQEYPKLTIISGTVATQRLLDPQKQPEKISKIKEALKTNHLGWGEIVEKRLLKEIKSQNFFVIRNTAYVFSAGKCTQRHDKTKAFQETKNFIPKNKVIFRPGVGSSQRSTINKCFGIEICREHADGVMRDQIESNLESVPLIQFILSDGVMLIPRNCISPYVVFIDSMYQIRFITELPAMNTEVSLYSCDAISATTDLHIIPPETAKSYVSSYIMSEINDEQIILGCHLDLISLDEKGHYLLSKADYSEIIKWVAHKYSQYSDSPYVSDISYLLEYLIPLSSSLEKPILEEIQKIALKHDHKNILGMMKLISVTEEKALIYTPK